MACSARADDHRPDVLLNKRAGQFSHVPLGAAAASVGHKEKDGPPVGLPRLPGSAAYSRSLRELVGCTRNLSASQREGTFMLEEVRESCKATRQPGLSPASWAWPDQLPGENPRCFPQVGRRGQ
jgi:hypothetical protein